MFLGFLFKNSPTPLLPILCASILIKIILASELSQEQGWFVNLILLASSRALPGATIVSAMLTSSPIGCGHRTISFLLAFEFWNL